MGVVFSDSHATQQEHAMTNQVNPLIKQLEKKLPTHGHLAKPIGRETLIVRLPAAPIAGGGNCTAATAVIHPDQAGTGLVIECCWALNTAQADTCGAILAKCTETAFKLPLVQVQHDPQDGEVRLRVDCFGGAESVQVEHVVRSLTALTEFVTAMTSPATAPAAQVAATCPTAAERAPARTQTGSPAPATTLSPTADTAARLEALARKPGGINRLEKLLRINQQRRPPETPSSN